MAINFGDVLGGLGAAYGGRAQEYAQGIQQREQGLTERKRAELEARQKAMYQDGYQAFQMLSDGNIDGIISLANDRLEMLSTFPDADPSDTLGVIRDAEAAKAGDPMAIRNLSMTLSSAAQTAQRMGLVPQQEQERGVVVGGNLVGQNTGRLMYQAPSETPQEPAAVQSLRIRASESGLMPGTPEYSDFMRSGGGGGQIINVDTSGASDGPAALVNKIDEQAAAYINAGSTSASLGRDLSLLIQLAPLTTQGVIPAAISSIYPGYNDANTAFTGIVSQALPKLRVPGSGAQSDKDIDVLLAGFGKLQPSNDTKMLLIDAMNAKNQIDQQRADIATQYAAQEINRTQYLRAIRAIDSQSIIPPALQASLNRIVPSQSQSDIPQSASDAGVTADQWSLMTTEERGGWK